MAHTKHLIQNMKRNGLRSSFTQCYRLQNFQTKKKTSEMAVILTTTATFVTYSQKAIPHGMKLTLFLVLSD